MHTSPFQHGQRAALRDLGLTKTAFFFSRKPPEITDAMRLSYESGLPEAQRGGQWVVQGKKVSYHPPAAAPVIHDVPNALLEQLGKPKQPFLSRVPLSKVVGGGLALGGGAMLAHHLLSDPQVEVQPSLPMRTMFP